jgi:hypothetical protein
MVRKQGGLINSFAANENVVARCLNKIKEVEPTSLADRLFHITLKTEEAYTRFTMDGFEYTTDVNGNFSSIAIAGATTPEIYDLRFTKAVENCVVCFIY